MNHRTSFRAAAAAATLLLASSLVACGTATGTKTLPTAGNDAPSSAAPNGSPAGWSAFNDCMTKRGFPPTKPGSGPHNIPDGDAFFAANTACQPLAPKDVQTANAAADARIMASQLKLAKCMRARGYDFPDPKPNDSGASATGFQLAPGQSADQADNDQATCAQKAGLASGSFGSSGSRAQ